MNQVEQGKGLVVVCACAGRFEAHQMEEWLGAPTGTEIVRGYAKLAQVFGRKVDPVALRILADVAQDVGQLKRHAAFFGQRQRAGRIETEDVHDGQPDYGGHLVAVLIKLTEGFNLARFEIGKNAFDHFTKILVRN